MKLNYKILCAGFALISSNNQILAAAITKTGFTPISSTQAFQTDLTQLIGSISDSTGLPALPIRRSILSQISADQTIANLNNPATTEGALNELINTGYLSKASAGRALIALEKQGHLSVDQVNQISEKLDLDVRIELVQSGQDLSIETGVWGNGDSFQVSTQIITPNSQTAKPLSGQGSISSSPQPGQATPIDTPPSMGQTSPIQGDQLNGQLQAELEAATEQQVKNQLELGELSKSSLQSELTQLQAEEASLKTEITSEPAEESDLENKLENDEATTDAYEEVLADA